VPAWGDGPGNPSSLLVLWDIDGTLLVADGAGWQLYERALADLYGLRVARPPQLFAGRTDMAIALEILALAGVPDPAGQLRPFHAHIAAHAPTVTDHIASRGRMLPGAAAAIAALAGPRHGTVVVQSVLTGNIPELARVKLAALGLTEHLDLAAGAYGDISAVRADLVAVARQNAAVRHGGDFSGRAAVLVGDTPGDVAAALATGASAVGVATGSFSAPELAEAGAHLVLPDLTDTAAVVAAITGAAVA
jgi:phosphoglycolate phosphatase